MHGDGSRSFEKSLAAWGRFSCCTDANSRLHFAQEDELYHSLDSR
jgi:hypothetical protein